MSPNVTKCPTLKELSPALRSWTHAIYEWAAYAIPVHSRPRRRHCLDNTAPTRVTGVCLNVQRPSTIAQSSLRPYRVLNGPTPSPALAAQPQLEGLMD